MISAVSRTLSALADPTRRTAVEALAEGPLSAGQLATRLEVTPAALTRHLRLLRQAGLVTVSLDEADSRRHLYAILPGPLVELTEWADHVARFWADQLASYARHAVEDRDAG